ncbi:MAG: TonB-dependent receptor, partial [Bacteroidales bacterium]|nr:TonB-dependent receptor [Bacteroidales bacterium]
MKQTIKCFIAAIAAMFVAVSAYAQITTSSLGGRVIDVNGEPVIGAAVVATHEPSGTVYGVVTNEDGRYTINGMRSGGPYKVEISCLGYQTVINTDVTLQLAEQFSLNSTLNEDKEMLSEAVVIGQAASRFAGEKTGAATNISSAQMESLPTVSRSITDITKLSPYGGSGTSFAGMDGRSSNFTVDGANFNNNFGLSSGLPGGGSPISIDAIDEVQVVVSPYDVRQTNFIGGGINAITKSGTNQFRGTAYVYHRNENMRGNVVDGTSLGEREMDRYTTYGFTLGGPIIKNKLFFFANFEYSKAPTVVNRWRPSKDGVANPDLYISRTTVEDMEKVKKHLAGYGYDAGSYTDYPADESNMKLLARIDWNITDKHHLAVRYNHTLNRGWNNTNASSSNCTQRTTEGRLSQYAMAFSNSMYSMDNKVNSVTLDLNSRFTNNLSNQFLATFSQLDDIRGTNSSKFPFIDILDGSGKIMPYISAGYELFTWNNGVHNQVLTIKDDLTYYLGNHKIMGGFSFEYQMADNSYMRNGTGYYRYSSLDDFLTGAAPETVAITYGYDGELNPAARVRFNQYGLYAQDEWSATDNFKLTYGLRFDAIAFNNADLMRNNAIYELDYAGKHIDTGAWPTTKIQLSPRVGFSWDVLGDKSLKVRGGTGLFAGRLPLVFFTNMPTNSGMVQNVAAISTSYKDGVAVPDELLQHFKGQMITDVDKLVAKLNSLNGKKFPTSISPEDGVLPSQIQAVDPKFKMPQVWKTS